VEPVYESKEHYHKLLGEHVAQLSSLQQLLYASNRYAILLIFQAMDAAGKDGAIKHVMPGVNPQGCQVYSFKHPSPAELQHDFLGAPPVTYRNAGGSASSTDRTTRRC
jgi:polyphosphate kinase 2 (PPK2 family)